MCGTEMRQHGVSVRCKASDDGDPEWFMCKESGRLPVCEEPGRCGCDEGLELVCIPQAHVVIRIDCVVRGISHSGVAIGLLSRSGLIAAERIMESHSALKSVNWTQEELEAKVKRMFMALENGAFSACKGELCTPFSVCEMCFELPYLRRRFVKQQGYYGVLPRGQQHWFSGVTDACGDVWPSSMPWLRCRSLIGPWV